MPKQAQLADGTILEFPDETPDDVMDRAVRSHIEGSPSKDKSKSAPKKPAPKKERGAFEQWARDRVERDANAVRGGVQGLRQLATGVGQTITQGGATGELALGLVDRLTGRANPLTATADAMGADAQASRQAFDASPAGQSYAGKAGAAAGQYGPSLAVPGGAAKTVLGRVVSGVTQGAIAGGMQPVEPGGSRAENAAVGGGFGLGGAIVGETARLAGSAVRSLRQASGHMTKDEVVKAASDKIKSLATDARNLTRAAPSNIPGVRRTLAEETLDPGIGQLQRQFPTQIAQQQAENNVARRAAIRQEFHGADDDAIAAIQRNRDAEAARQLKGLRATTAPALTPVKSALDRLINNAKGRPEVQKHLAYAKGLLDEGAENADQAYNIRKTFDDLMNGKLGGEQASAKLARKELMVAKAILDREMAKVVPVWRDYLRGYKAASVLSDEAKVGRKLLDAGPGGNNAATGERALSPDKFARLTNSEPDLVRAATKFPRSRTQLQTGQRRVISDVRDDLSREATARDFGKAAGSPTVENIGTRQALASQAKDSVLRYLIQRVPGGTSMTERLTKLSEEKVQQLIVEMLQDPARARTILASLPQAQRSVIQARLARASQPVAAAGAAAAPLNQGADK